MPVFCMKPVASSNSISATAIRLCIKVHFKLFTSTILFCSLTFNSRFLYAFCSACRLILRSCCFLFRCCLLRSRFLLFRCCFFHSRFLFFHCRYLRCRFLLFRCRFLRSCFLGHCCFFLYSCFLRRSFFHCCLFRRGLLFLLLFRRAGEYRGSQGRYCDLDGIFPLVALLCPACLDSRIRHSLSAVFLPVSIEDFLIFSVEGHSHLIFLIGNSREIEYREDRLFRF